MRFPRTVRDIAWAALALHCLALPCTGQNYPVQKTISRTQQFHVFCDDANTRAQVAMACEDVKARLLQTLDLRDQWKMPVVVVVRILALSDSDQAPWRFGVFQTELGLRLHLDINIGDSNSVTDVRLSDRIIEALLTEIIYRDGPTIVPGKPYQPVYQWIIEGMAELVCRPDDEPYPGALFQALLASSKTISFRQMLARDPKDLDSPSRAIYRSYAMALIETLFSQPEGRKGFRDYLQSIPQRRREEMFSLGDCFPLLAQNADSLDKWWSLSLARMSTSDKFLPLTPSSTESKLLAVLQVQAPEKLLQKPKSKAGKGKEAPAENAPGPVTAQAVDPNTEKEMLFEEGPVRVFELKQFKEYVKIPEQERKRILSSVLQGLYGLGTTGHPMYYAIIGEYQRLAGLIAEGKTNGLEKEFARLEEARAGVLNLFEEIDDYLNWFEATQLETKSGAFDAYMKEAKIQEAVQTRRNDAISKYLDIVEAELR